MLSSANCFANSIEVLQKRQGAYTLIGGTDACADKILWKEVPHCGGFMLADSNAESTVREVFCHFNSQQKQLLEKNHNHEVMKISYRVTLDENRITKKQNIERSFNNVPYTVETESSITLDDEETILYDRSISGKGTSCLYKKVSVL